MKKKPILDDYFSFDQTSGGMREILDMLEKCKQAFNYMKRTKLREGDTYILASELDILFGNLVKQQSNPLYGEPNTVQVMLKEGWKINYIERSRCIEGRHPNGGKRSLCEMSSSVTSHRLGYTIAALMRGDFSHVKR